MPAEVLPADKDRAVADLQARGLTVAMVGDGGDGRRRCQRCRCSGPRRCGHRGRRRHGRGDRVRRGGAGVVGALLPHGRHRLPPRPGSVLDQRPHRRQGPPGDRHDRRQRVGRNPLPTTGLGRRPATVHLPRADRRNHLHRVRRHPPRDHRPAYRPPRPRSQQSTVDGQGVLFTVWRYHAAFTDSPYVLVQAEAQHRGHAIIEQAFAELIDGLAHLPSGRFNANNAWLTCIAEHLGATHSTLQIRRTAGSLPTRRRFAPPCRSTDLKIHVVSTDVSRDAQHEQHVDVRRVAGS